MKTATIIELENEQMKLEAEALLEARHKVEVGFIAVVEQGRLQETPLGTSLLRISIDLVTEKIKEYLDSKQFRGAIRIEHQRLRDFFKGREKQLAYITLNSVLSTVSRETKGVVTVSRRILDAIDQVLAVEKLKKYDPKVYNFLEYEYKKQGSKYINKKKLKLSRLKGFDKDNLEASVTLGSHLLDCVLKCGSDVFTMIKLPYKAGMIHIGLSDRAMRLLSTHKEHMTPSVFSYKPLVVTPVKHTELYGSGGYFTYKNIPIVKARKRHLSTIKDTFNTKGKRLLDIINKIQEVEWCVNSEVLDVMSYIIDNNLVDPRSTKLSPKLYGGIPSFETLDIDEQVPKASFGKLDNKGRFLNDEDYDRYYRHYVEQEIANEVTVSKRFGYMYALNTAKKYLKYSKFYYTYQLDYRFRLYPMQQALNPQLGSNQKALLKFYRGCVLDEDGLYWFRVHGANCYGYDKEPYDIRVNSIIELEDTIQTIAEDPIGNLKLWCDTDSPFEFLAFCFEYNRYLKDNTASIHIPVALDATCSGIQIYSGLLRDSKGATAVNVVGDTRNDIYKEVAIEAENLLAQGSYSKELTFKKSDGTVTVLNTELEASSLRGNITRRLTKRNVMTTPYSVTQRGMFDQVMELLKEDESDGNIWWKGDKWVVVKLITELNTQAIANVVQGASQGQQYIKEVTNKIATENQYLHWESPILQLPMLQKVNKEKVTRVITPFGKLVTYKPTDDINRTKMLSSIAPNFIHNLDATLMYLTVEKCIEAGVNLFWLIHDSYGVLPNDVKHLNKAVRESYIELFSQDILKDWTEQLGVEFDESVMINTLDLQGVSNSSYIFS